MRWGTGSVSGDVTRAAVLAPLARRGPLSRAEIAELLRSARDGDPAAVALLELAAPRQKG
jgi:hypothetical protein